MVQDFASPESYLNAWRALAQTPRDELSIRSRLGDPRASEEVDGWSETVKQGIPLDGEFVARATSVLDIESTSLFEDFPSVIGVALSLRFQRGAVVRSQPCLTFFVTEKFLPEELESRSIRNIPKELEGIPTDVVAGGSFEFHHAPGDMLRPVEPGTSISHGQTTGGTLGCLVEDDQGNTYLLSSAHVLSPASAKPGDPIVQPGTQFGGASPADQIATLTKSIPLQPGVCVADAAIAEVANPGQVMTAIRHTGGIKPGRPRVVTTTGVQVQKSGDTTGLTDGSVISPKGRIGPHSAAGVPGIFFNDAIVTTAMSQPGDSGSILMDNRGFALGILFGGFKVPNKAGQTAYVASWYNPIGPVLKNLGVRLVP